jgi:hypothetical protein
MSEDDWQRLDVAKAVIASNIGVPADVAAAAFEIIRAVLLPPPERDVCDGE